jgi:outer membrane protein assembly factor BamA
VARRSLCAVSSFLCVLVATSPAAASVADYIGKPVASVRIVVEGRDTTDSMLTSIVETAVGRALSMAQVRETVAHLFSLGQFEGVSVDATLENGRVALRYDLVPIHAVSRLRFDGAVSAPGIDTDAMRRAIVDRYGASPPLSRLSDMTRILSEVVRERGYLHAAITPRVEISHESERATIVFAIDAGARTTIGDVAVAGQPMISRDELLRRLGLSRGAPYQRDELNARIERYVEERRRVGYYEAAVVPTVKLSDDDKVADLALTVTPGPRVRVEFLGDSLPADRRAELVPVMREGSVATPPRRTRAARRPTSWSSRLPSRAESSIECRRSRSPAIPRFRAPSCSRCCGCVKATPTPRRCSRPIDRRSRTSITVAASQPCTRGRRSMS